MDPFNPRCSEAGDPDQIMNEQNMIYGAQVWYNLIKGETPESVLVELSNTEMVSLQSGEPTNDLIDRLMEYVNDGFTFLKTTHKSCQQTSPIDSRDVLIDCLTHADIIMSLRRYKVPFLFFRKWVRMDCEFRTYTYKSKLRYIANYRGPVQKEQFAQVKEYIEKIVQPLLGPTYTDYTVDVYCCNEKCGIIEINSPLWLKAGTYNATYEWRRDDIHTAEKCMCYYKMANGEIEYFEN